jgi:hypothetical protein
MRSNQSGQSTLAALLVAAGIAFAGWAVADGLLKFRTADRYVSVKGLAEREVPADLVVWPIGYIEAGNDLAVIYQQTQAHARLIAEFLKQQGLGTAEQSLSTPRIQDNQADNYGQQHANRYKAEVTYTVRTSDVAAVKKAMEQSGELVKSGVAFMSYANPPEFRYTKLNELKPELLAEATKNARRAAEQFAQDSASVVGNIRNASQGQISIEDRDTGTPDIKRIRVVTTIDYELRNPD